MVERCIERGTRKGVERHIGFDLNDSSKGRVVMGLLYGPCSVLNGWHKLSGLYNSLLEMYRITFYVMRLDSKSEMSPVSTPEVRSRKQTRMSH